MSIISGTKIRIGINLISLATIIVAFYFLLIGNLFVFFALAILGTTFFLPRTVYRKLGLRMRFSDELLDIIEIVFSTLVLLSVVGYIWLYDNIYHYDAYVHFITPLLLFIVVSIFLSAFNRKLKTDYSKSDIILGALIIMMTLILVWELFEYGVTVLGFNMFYQVGEPNDSLYDILAGFLSLPVGAVLVYKYNNWFMGKVRQSAKVTDAIKIPENIKKKSKKFKL